MPSVISEKTSPPLLQGWFVVLIVDVFSYLLVIDCKNRLFCEHLYNQIGKYHELCRNKCDKFIQNYCDKLLKFPFVCNKCIKKGKCRFNGKIYDAEYADKKAKNKLSTSRSSLHICEDEFNYINNIVSPLLIENKQSLSHILTSHPEIKEFIIYLKKSHLTQKKTINLE